MDFEDIRKQFPQLKNKVDGKDSVYLDSAATALKPNSVLKTLETYYLYECANIHRGIHYLSELNTSKFENVRKLSHKFLNSRYIEEIIFTKGTTDSINLLAYSWGEININKGDEILITQMEHHANIVPWQLLCESKGAYLKVAPINDKGEIILEEFSKLISAKTKLCAFTYVSNTLGTINPIREMTSIAHSNGSLVFVDAAQAAPHLPIDVINIDCDFLALSGHKIYGPTGIGILYGKKELLEKMRPYQSGGSMIDQVSFDKTTFNCVPHIFEAGTPHIAGVLGMGTAIEFLQTLDFDSVIKYEEEILQYAHQELEKIKGLTIIGTAKNKCAVISFTMDSAHPHDIATIANKEGIALRTGHHCTQPLMKRFNVPATARASFSIYNTKNDVDRLVQTLNKINELFG